MTSQRKELLEVLQTPFPEETPSQYPTGWYWASFTEDLRRGRVKPLQVMGGEYALFRTGSGAVGMVEARCCHMGADLSRCGKVQGDRLVCGYHGWEFGVDGVCGRVPDVQRIPASALQSALPITEVGGNIWFWHGPAPARPFVDLSYLDTSQYVTLKGEVHVARCDPLPVIEHIADIYHFPHNHRSAGPAEYVILEDEGSRFEFQLTPRGSARRIQGFQPYAFIEMAGPCSGIYRTQDSAEVDRSSPLLTLLLGVTPVRRGITLFTWRIGVRKPLRKLPIPGAHAAFARLIWLVIRRNVHVDLEVLRWMRPPERCLWVRPDGPSVRRFRAFYERNLPRHHSSESDGPSSLRDDHRSARSSSVGAPSGSPTASLQSMEDVRAK